MDRSFMATSVRFDCWSKMSEQLQHLFFHRKVQFIFQNVTLISFSYCISTPTSTNLISCFSIILGAPWLCINPYHFKLKAERHSFILYFHGNLLHVKNTADGKINPYPTAFPYGNGMVLHFYQQQENSTTKTVHKVINKRLKTYV